MLDCTSLLHKFDLFSDKVGDFSGFLDRLGFFKSHGCGLLSLLIIN